VRITTKRAALCFDRGPAPSWRLRTNGKDRITLCWLSHFVCGIGLQVPWEDVIFPLLSLDATTTTEHHCQSADLCLYQWQSAQHHLRVRSKTAMMAPRSVQRSVYGKIVTRSGPHAV
jgi:hypothetical protein